MSGCLLWPFNSFHGKSTPNDADRDGEILDVVGESFYRDNLRRVCGRPTAAGEDRWVWAILVPDPQNQYDPNAVRVEIAGRIVGHLPREIAPEMQPTLPPHGLRVAAHIRGGWLDDTGQAHYSVRIVIPEDH